MRADENDIIERRTGISGIGQSEIGRRLYRDPLQLTLEACLAAIDDAGLTIDDIDGVSTYPGSMAQPVGYTGAGAIDVIDALRIKAKYHNGALETSGQLGSIVNACLAVGAGLADHVLCFRSVWEGSAQGSAGRAAVMPGQGESSSVKASGFSEWSLPFSMPSAATWIAMYAQRHMHLYGTTEEQLAWVALNARRNAERNPNAIYRDPMTMDDYLAARMISSPLRLFDCDVPCDGATAVIVSRRERAADLPKPLLRIEAVGTAMAGRPSWDQFDDLSTMSTRDAGAHLWTRTDLTPSDVDIAQLYDGFSFLTLSWLEALGLCPVGESGAFVEGGERIALDGELPLNTSGGQLSGGRLHGYGFLHEAALQLWGEADGRQVTGDPQVAVVAAGGGNTCGCLLLVKE
jgi:acetyl-CoA acetyltransferase